MDVTAIRTQDPATKTYLGSPSIVRLPGGELLVTHDYFGPGSPRNHEEEEHLSSVYRSTDEGRTWHNVTHVAGAFWSSLFVLDGAVHLLGTSQQYGSIVIRRSTDGGYTWTHPADDQTGLLFRGAPRHQPPNYHCAPTPVIVHDGRIYRSFEDCDPCEWGAGFLSCVISAPVGADLLKAANWRMSDKTRFSRDWLPADWGELSGSGVLEGNVVASPSGELWNVLRLHSAPVPNKAIILRVEADGRKQRFVRWIEMPGGLSKFTIRQDPETRYYITLSNSVPDTPEVRQFVREWNMCPRNTLSLHASADLLTWTHGRTLLEDDLGLPYVESMRKTGFQYADWVFHGNDILAAVRTAYRGAHNLHDSNMITYHRVRGFRRAIGARPEMPNHQLHSRACSTPCWPS